MVVTPNNRNFPAAGLDTASEPSGLDLDPNPCLRTLRPLVLVHRLAPFLPPALYHALSLASSWLTPAPLCLLMCGCGLAPRRKRVAAALAAAPGQLADPAYVAPCTEPSHFCLAYGAAYGLQVTPNLPSDDLAAVLTGIYGSAPGCLCTFPNSPACPGAHPEGPHSDSPSLRALVYLVVLSRAAPLRAEQGALPFFLLGTLPVPPRPLF